MIPKTLIYNRKKPHKNSGLKKVAPTTGSAIYIGTIFQCKRLEKPPNIPKIFKNHYVVACLTLRPLKVCQPQRGPQTFLPSAGPDIWRILVTIISTQLDNLTYLIDHSQERLKPSLGQSLRSYILHTPDLILKRLLFIRNMYFWICD